MASNVVSYAVGDAVARFEIDPTDEFHPVGVADVVGNVKDAVHSAVEAAKAVLDKAAELKPEEIHVKFGVKVNGTANWLVARTAAEANFEITLTWRPQPQPDTR